MKRRKPKYSFECSTVPVCLTCRRAEPVMHWWPELEVPGFGRMYNLAMIGEQWFMLEFPAGSAPVNRPELRLRLRRIAVNEEWFADGESMSDYCRRKAREWVA